ncbi:type VI secretion system membrane subunit TssM [Rubrivirga sp. IMCC43871]|uniref:type VI secretion system membrane subunit TssM n=1 Tax=Rubrivirga sp. IMCC43871 TaxID=3391575 RepID=UPI00399032A9
MNPRNLFYGALATAGVSGLVIALFRYGLPMTTLLLIVISMLVMAIVGLAVSAMRARRKKGGSVEDALRAQSEREAASMAPDRRAEIQRMQESFDQAVTRLKASSLGEGGRFGKGKRALYALPWYLVVGPPGAGKTTALLQSGLRFPAGAERVRGVGGTRNCDWFFTDEAILLDTAGRYTTEDEDRDEWNAFLDALRESRPDRPINGVVVGIAAQDLLGDERDLEDHADNIRRRIDELVARLGLGLPVYLVITKTDLVPGFVDVFGELDRAGREQVWGATVEPHVTADPSAVVEREFDTLLEALKPHRDARLARDLRREERRRVYSFPLEFGALKERLATFAGLVFAPDPLADGPLFRGFYFTSGTQEGAPIDRVIGALAEQFGLRTPPPPRPPAEPKSYFLKGVFTDVVFRDRYLARRTKKAAGATWRAMTRTGLVALGVAAIAATALGFAGARSGLDLRNLVSRADDASGATFGVDGARYSEVNRLEGLREEVARLGSSRPVSRALRMGLDRGDTVYEPAARLYYGLARDLVDVYAVRQLRTSLERARRFDQPDTTLAPGEQTAARRAAQRVDIENDLEAYLLLTTHSDSLRTSVHMRDALKTRLAELAPRGALGEQPADREAMTELVVRQTDAFVDGLAAGLAEPFEADPSLIAAAIDVVDVPPTLDGLYERIRREALARLAPLGLRDALLEEHLSLFAPAGTVPGFFTRDGWDRVVRQRFREAAADPADEYWALGRTAADLPPELRDADAVYDALMARYQREYVSSWTRFLHSVRYKPADGAAAEARLAILGSPTDSPIGWLLAVVSEQTTLPPEDTAPRSRGLLDRAASAVGMGDDEQASADTVDVVGAAFAGIHRLRAAGLQTGEADEGLYQALEALAQFGRRIGGAAGDRGLANDMLATTKDEIEQGTRGMDRQTRQNLFFSPLDITTTLTVERVTGEAAAAEAAATSEAEAEAVAEVASAYREKVAGRYPFSPRSDRDAALDDARSFFEPGGDLDALAEALGPDGGSPALRRAIERGQRIGRVLSGDLSFRLRADLPSYSNDAAQRELAVDAIALGAHGRNTVYQLGSRRWEDMRWPGAPGAYVTVQRAGGPLTIDAEGDWALFRLLQQATIRPQGGTLYDVSWSFSEGPHSVTVRYEMRTSSENSPLANVAQFFQFSLP